MLRSGPMGSQSTHVALITGAGTGIGRACALRLDARGHATVLAGRRAEPLQSLAASLTNPALVVPTDVTSVEQCQSLISAAHDEFGHIDV
ncbi:MAG: SDR family oxidoreductase, partial [Planctomycetota bacterium]